MHPGHQTPSWVEKIPQEILLNITEQLGVMDIKSLALTCRRFGFTLGGSCLVEADIKSGEYNSLFWACSFGDVALAKTCLRAGASPNVGFCPKSKHSFWPIQPERLTFVNPVFPTRFRCGEWLPDEDFACSALTLATKLDHVAVMRVLLGFWDDASSDPPTEVADLIERRLDSGPSVVGCTFMPEPSFWATRHSVSITHVRSLKAAELLITTGELRGNSHINSLQNMEYPPLELFLLRNDYRAPPKKPKGSRYRGKGRERPIIHVRTPDVQRGELKHLVQYFLDHGASSRQVDGTPPGLPGSPLMAAMLTRRLEVVKIMLQNGPLSKEDIAGDVALALSYALGEPCPLIWSGQCDALTPYPSDKGFHKQVLESFLDAGISSNATVNGERRLLSIACSNEWYPSVSALLGRGADPKIGIQSDLTPLTWSLRDKHDAMFCELLEFGADSNQPSIHLQGFTSLMFAAGDGVSATKFERLLLETSEKSYFGKLSVSGQTFSILQCILTGFPEPRIESDKTIYQRYTLDMFKYGEKQFPQKGPQHKSFEPPISRRSKFNSFVSAGLDSSQFYTNTGRHVINWAIDNLYGDELIWTIKLLAPYYISTRRLDDHESPLAALFAPHRLSGYLRFGTLPQACEALRLMLDDDFDKIDGVDRESILRCVCQLPSKMIEDPYGRAWKRVIDGCDVDVSCAVELLRAIEIDSDPNFDDEIWRLLSTRVVRQQNNRVPTNYLRLCDMKLKEDEYNRDRTARIANMITLLLERGVGFNTRNSYGTTAYEYSIMNGTIEFIDGKWRDLELEEEIARRRSNLG